MAFRRRFRRRRFSGRRAVARKEPIWITTAFDVTVFPQVEQQALFQLVGPEDYTPDYLTEESRKDRCTLVRTVGHFNLGPVIEPDPDAVTQTLWKAALFVAGDKEIDDAFAADPNQFNIRQVSEFVPFCRNFPPMHVFWFGFMQDNSVTLAAVPNRYPPAEPGHREWDVTVKRKLEGDQALFLLINAIFLQSPQGEIGGVIDVESRNLIMDQ